MAVCKECEHYNVCLIHCSESVLRNRGICEHFKNGWISVKDRLPEKAWEDNQKWFSKVVLAATGRSVLYGSFEVYKYNGTWEFGSYDEDFDFDRCVTVTHWMPLPEPPKEDER